MPKTARFWLNVTLIGLAHVAAIYGLIRWSRDSEKQPSQSIVWMNGGAGDGITAAKPKPATAPKPMRISTPPPTEAKPVIKNQERDEEESTAVSPKSEIQLSTPTPTPRSTSIPKALPVSKTTPKPTPKATPKPSPKKTILAKASPKPSPKVPLKAFRMDDEEDKAEAEPAKKKTPKPTPEKSVTPKPEATSPPRASTIVSGVGKGTSTGAGGHAGGAGGESPYGWYGSMLHDRFHSEWTPPPNIPSGAKLGVSIKLRIEKDGRVSSFEIVKPSGNTAFDESVAAVGKQVTQVEPPPPELLKGDHYNVRIKFEPDSD